MFPEALAQSEQQITHVDMKTSGPLLQSAMVKTDGIRPGGRGARSKSIRPIQRFDGAHSPRLPPYSWTFEPGAKPILLIPIQREKI